MPVWKNCFIDTYYDDGLDAGHPCEVRLDETVIEICYKDGPEFARYIGKNNGYGHFELRDDQVDGRASLHMFPGSKILEGYWSEQGLRGMWRITLSDERAQPGFMNASGHSSKRQTSANRLKTDEVEKPRRARARVSAPKAVTRPKAPKTVTKKKPANRK